MDIRDMSEAERDAFDAMLIAGVTKRDQETARSQWAALLRTVERMHTPQA